MQYEIKVNAPDASNDYTVTLTVTDDVARETFTIGPDDGQFKKFLKMLSMTDIVDLREAILTSELGNIMLDMVAPIYALTLYVFNAIGYVLEKETKFIEEDFKAQMFPQTATWGLVYWENEYGILPDNSKSLEQRRQYLLSIMYSSQPMTPSRLKQLVEGLTGFKCDITENYQPNTILVTIRGYVNDLKPVIESLDKKLPAHLNYIIRMAEFTEVEVNTAAGLAVATYKKYELEVLN